MLMTIYMVANKKTELCSHFMRKMWVREVFPRGSALDRAALTRGNSWIQTAQQFFKRRNTGWLVSGPDAPGTGILQTENTEGEA